MKKSFGARRVPRKIGGDDDNTDSLVSTPSATATDVSDASDHSSSVVKRPVNKSRKSSALRTSFAPSQFDDNDDNDAPSLIVPKRSNLSRLAVQRNAEKRPAADLSFRPSIALDESRPSYSKDHLRELKQSTPSTPQHQAFRASTDLAGSDSLALDIASKFGANLSSYEPPTAIPSDAEIKEKKERRARLAKEQAFISLDDDMDDQDDEEDDENVTRDDQGRLILKPKEKYAETRLVRDDEDLLEGFDDFTSDGKIGFGDKADRLAAKQRKAEMASLIADAEGLSDADTDGDESEAERNAAFEIAQTRHGNYNTRDDQDEDFARPQTPPKISQLPTLDSVVERLRKKLEEMETARMSKTRDMQRLVHEKATIGEEEVRVQAALKETGERYAQLRKELHPQQEDLGIQNGHADGAQAEASSRADESEDGADWEDDQVTEIPRAGLGAH